MLESVSRPPKQPPSQGALYGAEYFKERCGPIPYERNAHWLNFFGGIADEIVRSLRPRTVFDAGCAWGLLVESFWDRGVEARGVDISDYAIGKVRRDVRAHCSVTTLAEPIRGGPYDLVTCIEVLEHMAEEEARQAVLQMTQVTDAILFSSTPDDFDEPTHVNVRPMIYWLRLFAESQFFPDLLFDASFVAAHAFLVRRRPEAMPDDVLLLFNETLRNRIYRAAFLTRHDRIEQLEKESATLKQQLEESSHKLARSLEENQEMSGLVGALSHERELREQSESDLAAERELRERRESDLAALREELDDMRQRLGTALDGLRGAERSARLLDGEVSRLRGDEALWRARAEASEGERDHASQIAADLQRQLEESELQTARAEAIVEEWIAHSADLSRSLESLSRRHGAMLAELEFLQGNRSWRLIQRYRDWLRINRSRRPRAMRLLDLAVDWSLEGMNLVRGPAAPRPHLVAPAPINGTPPPHTPLRLAPPPQAPKPACGAETPGSGDYEDWIRENEPGPEELEIQRRMGGCFSYRPIVSVLVPVYKVPLFVLRETVESVIAQTYDNWELCLAVSGADNREALAYLEEAAAHDPRIRLKALAANEGISGNSNQALALATGEYLALLDHDDTLAPFALFEVVQLLNQDRAAGFIYSDKDQITEDGKRRLLPFFKPQWSPELLLNVNYLTHLCVMRTDHVREVGGWRTETDGAQDWDLFLRLVSRFGNVRHIPKVLYHWRQLSTSVASGGLSSKPYAAEAQVRAVKAHCDAVGLGRVEVRNGPNDLRLEWPVEPGSRVSIVYLSRKPGGEALERAADLVGQTSHPDFEILVPSPGDRDQEGRVRRVGTPANAGLPERIEAAVRAASGRTLVFIDESVTPAGPDWLREITGPLQLPEVGVVGARLVDASTGTLRHCGLVFTGDGRVESIYAAQPEHVCEQAGAAGWYRNWSAVSGACFSIRRDAWDAVGGLAGDVLHPRLDVHLNLKLRLQTEWRILYNPYARLFQSHESALEHPMWYDGRQETDYVRACFPDGDPYFHPHLDCRGGEVAYRRRGGDGRRPRGTDYLAESQELVQIYDFAPGQVERSRRVTSGPASGRLESLTWFLPEFLSPFYGGIHTILRFADAFRQRFGVRSHLCVLGHAPESRVRRQVAAAFPELAASSHFFVLGGGARVNELPATDAAVCSLWSTAFAALEFDKARRKFYFIQDDEALFYPAGSTSALVEATYGFGFHGICNTVSLLRRYADRGGQGEYFNPCIDPAVFHDRQRKPVDGPSPYTLFCYGRPGHPRNCFELLAATLRDLKQRLGDRLLVVTAGADWEPRDYRLEGVVHNLGLLNYQSTAALYRTCDAGVVMMMTRHPSYLPMELMGCGSLVVTNRNPDTAWLLRDGENCLLADLSPSSLSERIEEGLKDAAKRRSITAHARDTVQTNFSSWEDQIDKIYQYMLSVC